MNHAHDESAPGVGHPRRSRRPRPTRGRDPVAPNPYTELLSSRAREFLHSALGHLVAQNFHRFFVDAGVALELLGKAVLCQLNPALIVSKGDFESLIAVLHLPVAQSSKPTRIRTIEADDLLDRIARVLPSTEPDKPVLREILDLRNTSVHFVGDPGDHFAPLIACLHRYVAACADFLKIPEASLIPENGHREMLGYFDSRAATVWSGLAKKQIAEAKARLQGATPSALSTDDDPYQIPIIQPEGTLPDQIASSVTCPACRTCTEVQYKKHFTELTKSDISGDTFHVAYVLDSFSCSNPACALRLENGKLVEGAGMAQVLKGPSFDGLTELQENLDDWWDDDRVDESGYDARFEDDWDDEGHEDWGHEDSEYGNGSEWS